jgi:nucleoside-diphosphate-sugar epimerase
MRVLVTGGTGFLGCHVVAALARAGHEPLLLVRDPARIGPALAPLDLPDVAHVRGDVTDERVVAAAMHGVDAVIHAAALVGAAAANIYDARAVNAHGASVVLHSARQAGVGRIVHVSTYFVLLPAAAPRLAAGAPIGTLRDPYTATKAEAEAVARELRARGAPLSIVYPGSLFGPHDPHGGGAYALTEALLRGWLPLLPPGGLDLADVRDVAATIVRAVEPDAPAGAYLLTGHYASLRTLAQELGAVTGRALAPRELPRWALPSLVALARATRGRLRRLPDPDFARLLAAVRPGDDGPAAAALGFEPRPLAATLRDTVRALLDARRIDAVTAGRVATQGSAA